MAFWLMEVRGNLRFRIEKLGVEMHKANLTDTQRQLREMILQWPLAEDSLSEHPERPFWANKAFVFVNPDQIPELQRILGGRGITLQSKHVIVSNAFKDIVQELLNAGPLVSGREAFLRRKAKICHVQELGHFSDPSDMARGNEGINHIENLASASGGKDRAAGCFPRGTNCGEAESSQVDSNNSTTSTARGSSSSGSCCRTCERRDGL